MNYVDFAIAVSVFIFFFVIVLIFTTNFFGNLSALTREFEYRDVATNYFGQLFSKKGTPTDWETRPKIAPVELGFSEDLYRIFVLVKETGNLARSDEQITIKLVFDNDCTNKVWNDTLRIYDEDNNETVYELSAVTFCSSQFLQEGNISWELNASANESIRYNIYYSGSRNISAPNYTALKSSSTSWIPADSDEWTEATGNWSRYGGASGSVVLDTTNKKKGDASVNITGTFNSSILGLQYNPSTNITGVDNGWYVNGWVLVDDVSGLSNTRIATSDNNESISIAFGSNLSSNTWYQFSYELSSNGGWSGWSTFNASKGIDYVIIYMQNSTSGITRTLKVDRLYFSKKPLDIKIFPEETITSVSYSKIQSARNLSVDEILKILGQDYKVRIEVLESK